MKLKELQENQDDFIRSWGTITGWIHEHTKFHISTNDLSLVDGCVNVNRTIDIITDGPLRVQFGVAQDDFRLEGKAVFNTSQESSLKGCPHTVRMAFKLFGMRHLTSLQYGPRLAGAITINGCHKLTSLEFLPELRMGVYILNNEKLEDISALPKSINGYLHLANNGIKSIEHLPNTVNGYVDISFNDIESLVGIHEILKKVRGYINIKACPIKSGGIGLLLIEGLTEISYSHPAFAIIDNYVGRPNDIYECQAELIEAGYEEYAVL